MPSLGGHFFELIPAGSAPANFSVSLRLKTPYKTPFWAENAPNLTGLLGSGVARSAPVGKLEAH